MKGTNETEVLLVRINRLFGLFIQNREIYLKMLVRRFLLWNRMSESM